MNLTNALRVIARHKGLVIVGIAVALLAAFVTAFRVETLSLEPRVQQQYRADTQLLVTDPTSVFSTKTAPQALTDGQTPPQPKSISDLTVVYAYLVQSGEIQKTVEDEIGPLTRDESITAAQRTTQPTAQTNTGPYELPVLEISGTAYSADRAQRISREAAKAFVAFAAAQQQAAGVPSAEAVQFQTIRAGDADAVDGTSPALPIVAVGIGVLLAFLALIFAVDNAASTRPRGAVRAADQTASEQAAGIPPARPAVPAMARGAVPPQRVAPGGLAYETAPRPAGRH
jgi:hypothetical protein